MSDQKTKENDSDVQKFLAQIENEEKRNDCLRLIKLMEEISGEPAKMWGKAIVGFGSYHYTYASGREGDWMLAGFSPRKSDLSIYIIAGVEHRPELLKKLGKYKQGKSCLYVKNLEQIDMNVLGEIVSSSVGIMKSRYK